MNILRCTAKFFKLLWLWYQVSTKLIKSVLKSLMGFSIGSGFVVIELGSSKYNLFIEHPTFISSGVFTIVTNIQPIVTLGFNPVFKVTA